MPSEDRAIDELFWGGAWHLYSDLEEHKLMGRYALTRDGKTEACRWIMFLKTDSEYEWPRLHSGFWLHWMLFAFVTLGLSERIRVWWQTRNKDLDRNYWPFRNQFDFGAAKQEPRYFTGKMAKQKDGADARWATLI